MPRRRNEGGWNEDKLLELTALGPFVAPPRQCTRPEWCPKCRVDGFDCRSYFADEDERRAAYWAHRNGILAMDGAYGRRPWSFWRYEAPGLCECDEPCDVPAPADHDGKAAYLWRMTRCRGRSGRRWPSFARRPTRMAGSTSMRRTCRGCDRVLGVSGDGFCVRCEHVRPVQWIIADLDRRGYPHTGRLRRFVRHYGELVDQQRDVEHERRCEHCHGPLPARRSGPPATYCSARCRKAAWRERVRDGSAA